MKSQTQHIGNYSNVFDYSPFGAPLDGRTIQNIFHQEEITDTSTVLKTIYVLEETFDVASDWQDVASYSQISYPSGKMEVKNPSSFMRLIGAKKDFTTGTGQHAVSFEIASLPAGMSLCQAPGGVIMGAQYNKTSDTLVGTGSYQIQSVSPHYVVVEIRNENNALVLKDSTNSTGTYSYAFSAPQGKEYTISFHNKSMCANLGYQIDNVFISYDTLEVVTGNTIIVSDTLFIINNDFENPVIEPNGAGVKIDGWTHYSPSTTLSVEPHNGSDWLKVVSTNGTHGAHQAFAVEPGESYTFEIDLHRPAGMNKEINIVIWKNTGPSGAYTLHVLNTDGSNTFNYTATSSNIYIQIRQAGTYYLDNIRMYRTYEDTIFVSGYEVEMAYRYGFGGQEKDNEIYGTGNSYTAEFWQYDPRLGRRWNIDPMSFKYPWQSPYVAFNNNPIFYNDPLGLEGEEPKDGDTRVENGRNEVYVDGSWGYDASGGEEIEVVGKEDPFIEGLRNRVESIESNPQKTSSPKIENWVWDMVQEIPTTELSLSMASIDALGGFTNAKKLLEEGKFEVKFNGSKKTWSINFFGNQHVDAEFVKSSKVRAMDIASTKTSALKVVKGVGITMNFIGLGMTTHNAYTEISTDGYISIETGADAVFGIVGFLGPVGTAVSAGYFLIKPIGMGGHNAAIKSGATVDHYGTVSYEEMWDLFKSGW